MAEGDTLYNPGKSTFRDVVWKEVDKRFPELKSSGHYDFNKFLAQHPELQGMTEHYNVIGGMNVADVIQPDSTWYSNPVSLSALGGIYGLWDSYTSGVYDPGLRNQTYKEGLADAYRNIKGIGIQRDFNPLGLLYDEKEADYYKGLYGKFQKDYKKNQLAMEKFKVNKMLMNIGGGRTFVPSDPRPGPGPGGGGGWSPSGADLSPGGGYGQSPTGSDIAGTPFSRGGILGAF